MALPAKRSSRKKTLGREHLATNKTVLKAAGLYTIFALINGLSLFFITKTVYPQLPYDNALFVIGASSLAASASMLAIFAPSGLGVREGIQLVLFGLIMPKEFALAATVFARLWSIVIDFVFFGLSASLNRRRQPR